MKLCSAFTETFTISILYNCMYELLFIGYSMTASTLGDSILLPDPDIPPVTAHSTAVDHTPSLIGHMAALTCIPPGAGVLS